MGKRFDVLLFPGGKRKAFTLSYDDGVIQDRRLVALCEKYHVKGTFNLGYGVLGYQSPEGMPFDISKVTPAEAKELYKNQEIGGHSLYHSDLTSLGSPYAIYEILEDKRQLEKIAEKPLTMFAYPFGFYNDKVKELLKIAGYKGARTVNSTYSFDLPKDPLALDPTCHHNDEKLFELAKQFLEKPVMKASLFYVWGHAYEFDRDDNWERIEELLKMVSPHEEEIWFATNSEILEYLEAYKMLEYSVDGSMIYNPTSTDLLIGTSFHTVEEIKAGTLTHIKDTPL
ncbi:MAG: polysaccharide deacetylase family protein [Erysipelotrichaceae bacterium]|nr:polysaccharide deacetylase family protein [Erysipelotrichaceae bacterium]